MVSIEKICNNFSNHIANALNLDDAKKSVITYGIFAFIQMSFSIILVIIFGLLLKVAIEAMIVSFSISILRKSSGGVHASSPGRCAIIGTVISVGFALITKHISLDIRSIFFIGILIFIWSFYMIYKLAPVDSGAKPIKNQRRRKKLKRSSMMILGVYLLVVIFNIIYYYYKDNVSVLTYTLCIYMGLVWQVFSLTKSGHLILGKIDAFFK